MGPIVLVGKNLVLRGLPSKIEVSWVLSIYSIHTKISIFLLYCSLFVFSCGKIKIVFFVGPSVGLNFVRPQRESPAPRQNSRSFAHQVIQFVTF